MKRVECPKCGDVYQSVGTHWRYNQDHRLNFTQHQKKVITGLLMGDGTILRNKGNPRIQSLMSSKNYLEYIDNIFGCLGTGVSLYQSADEAAKENRDSGFRPNAKTENYSDLYFWASRSHPELQEFAEWYSTGKKVWPEDVELTPTVLKHWYCGDGSWINDRSKNHIQISMNNEVENTDKVDQMFENVGLSPPNNYNIYEQNGGNLLNCTAVFNVKQSKELWKYMGDPLPDFEYKWPEQYNGQTEPTPPKDL